MTKRRVDRDKDQRKEGEGQQGPREGCRVTRKGKDREGQGSREGWRGTRVKGMVERDKNQGKS